MSRIDIEDMLDRYLKGEASPGEIERVEAWLNSYENPGKEWQQMDANTRSEWLSAVFDDITAAAGIDSTKVITMPPRRNMWRSIAAVAAVLVVFFTIYHEWGFIHNKLYPVQLTALNVPVNQKRQIILADGSRIWINSASQLKYPGSFAGDTREVYLSGEAYFDIKHDASRPFIIHTGKVITTVLGTAFNIKDDHTQHTIVVTVTRGKVSVADGQVQLGTITPNQQISYNTINKQHARKNVNAGDAIAWQGDIHFNDITFADAAAQLQQRFNVKIGFSNEKVKNCRFTGTALKGEKLEKILNVLCAFNKATYQTNEDGSILINGVGCD